MELAHRMLTSRRGTAVLAALAALLAIVVVLAYVSRYRAGVDTSVQPVSVLVAKKAIAKGTSGDVILSGSLFETQRLRQEEAAAGAYVDPAALRGRVATTDIFAGEQLTAADFGATSSALSTKLTGTERAVSIPLDRAHGLIGRIEAGDHVDVVVGFNLTNAASGIGRPVVKAALQNVPVLAIDKSDGTTASSATNVTLQVTAVQAAKLAYAADNGKIWLVLRPRTGAPQAKAPLITVESLLGLTPVSTGGGAR